MDSKQAHLHHVLPVFLLTTDYSYPRCRRFLRVPTPTYRSPRYFVRNLCETARMLEMVRACETGSAESWGGIYTWQPPSYKMHETWLKARGVPWAIRKIILTASKKTEVVITHDPGRHYASAFAVPMFGRAEFSFNLDGEKTPYCFGKDPEPHFFYTASLKADTVSIRIDDEKHRRDRDRGRFYKLDTIAKMADGSLKHTQRWLRRDGDEVLASLEADLVEKTGK